MLQFVDSFSHYTQAFMTDKWDVVETGSGGTTLAQSVSGVGRSDEGGVVGGGVVFSDGAAPDGLAHFQYMQKNYNGVGTIICGFAFQQNGTQNAFNTGGELDPVQGGRLLTFLSGATVQAAITVLPSGQLAAIRASAAGT